MNNFMQFRVLRNWNPRVGRAKKKFYNKKKIDLKCVTSNLTLGDSEIVYKTKAMKTSMLLL